MSLHGLRITTIRPSLDTNTTRLGPWYSEKEEQLDGVVGTRQGVAETLTLTEQERDGRIGSWIVAMDPDE